MQFTEAVVNLKFDEEPKYSAYVSLFEPLCGPAGQQRPILTEGVAKVGQKRNRESLEDETLEIVRPPPPSPGVMLCVFRVFLGAVLCACIS